MMLSSKFSEQKSNINTVERDYDSIGAIFKETVTATASLRAEARQSQPFMMRLFKVEVSGNSGFYVVSCVFYSFSSEIQSFFWKIFVEN